MTGVWPFHVRKIMDGISVLKLDWLFMTIEVNDDNSHVCRQISSCPAFILERNLNILCSVQLDCSVFSLILDYFLHTEAILMGMKCNLGGFLEWVRK